MKFLLWAVSLLLLLALLIVGAAATVWWKPEILLNEKRLRQALRWAPAGTEISWTKLALDFRSRGWAAKDIHLTTEGFCFRQTGIDTCIKSLELDLSVSVKKLRPRITRIGALTLDLGYLTLAAGAEAPGPLDSSLPDLRPPVFADIFPPELKLDLIGALSLRLANVKLENASGPPTEITAELSRLPLSADGLPLSLKGGLKEGRNLDIELDADGVLSASPAAPSLRLKGRARGRTGEWRWRTPFSLLWADRIELSANATTTKPYALRGSLRADWRPDRIRLDVSDLASSAIWKQGRLGIKSCRISSRLDAAGLPTENKLDCDFFAHPKNRLIPRLDGKLGLALQLAAPNDHEIRFDYTFSESSADAFLVSDIQSNGRGTYDTTSGTLSEDTVFALNAKARIPEFRAWKEAWEGSPWAVPAPLHTLGGPVELELSSQEFSKEKAKAVLRLTTKLKDPKQSFMITADANAQMPEPLTARRSLDIDAKIMLNDVRLEAPPLGLEEPPQFLPDKRFVTTKQEAAIVAQEKVAATGMPVRWRLKVETAEPVRVHTNLLPNPLPIAVNLALAHDSSMSGYFELLPMPLKIFQKEAQIQRVRVSYQPGSNVGQLDGLLLNRTPEVTISILLLGSTENPRVEFQSDPPLSRQQIVSVLLFNKSLGELSEEEASSTQNMSQALSDGALGLFSLFFLSSTPIQSVGYDPVTQTYSARVSLGSKTTLSVGSNFAGQSSETPETREFGLRRRLGGPWAIRTELRQTQDRPDVVMTLLEWFKRF